MTAPRPALVPRDVLDLHGKQPHAIDEIKKGKVWRVSYERENHFLARWDTRQQLKLLGMDLSREETQWRIMQVISCLAEYNPGVKYTFKDKITHKSVDTLILNNTLQEVYLTLL